MIYSLFIDISNLTFNKIGSINKKTVNDVHVLLYLLAERLETSRYLAYSYLYYCSSSSVDIALYADQTNKQNCPLHEVCLR